MPSLLRTARQPSPLPLERDGSGRFLPWLIALMVFLAALSIGGAALIADGLARWDRTLQGTLTVELPRPTDDAAADAAVRSAVTLVRAVPGVASVRPLDHAEVVALLRPWLGENFDAADLPLPALLDVRLEPGKDIDRATLEQHLDAVVPGSGVERRGAWLDQLFRVARVIEWAMIVIVFLVGSVTVTAVVFTTRTGLALHAELIDLLHTMGATDSYIARQFQRHAFGLGLRGGIAGLIAAFLLFGAIRIAGQGNIMAVDLRFPLVAGLALLLLPPLVGLVGLLTARSTVLRSLARMP
jgi:cell division transport system permease protein